MRNEKGERLRLRLRLRQEEISAKVLQCCSQKGERGWRPEARILDIKVQKYGHETRESMSKIKVQNEQFLGGRKNEL